MIKLNQLCEINIGKTPSRAEISYWGIGERWISIADLKEKYITSTKEQITKLAIEQCNMKSIPKNTVIMSFKLTIGKVAITGEDAYSNEAIANFPILDKEKLIPEYLYYALQTVNFLGNTDRAVMGATLNKAKLNEVKIPWVNTSLQRKLVDILDKAQELIAKRKEQIQACDELIKSQFIELFGELKDEVELSQYISSLTAGKSLAGEAECKNKVLKTGSVSYDYFDANEVKNLPLDYEPLESHLVKQGNVIISRMNTAELVGATGYVWTTPDNTYLPDRLWRAEMKNNVNPIFLWQLLIQDSTKGKIRRIASGTSGSMKNISKQGLLGIKVINVDIQKQNQFAQFVQQVNKLKFEMEQSLAELENNFNSLMQRAFKGELF